jgi:undecaprenyl-diphosphatase
MDIILAALLGIMQGFTEWFPLSSSGHLVLMQTYYGGNVSLNEWIFFDISIHIASMLVVLLMFRKEVRTIIISFFRIFPEIRKGKKFKTILKDDPYKLFSVLIIVGTIPTVVIGYVFQRWFETMFDEPLIVGIALVFTGCILMLTYRVKGSRKLKDMKSTDAISIGVMQGIAIIPGVSRSGTTISTGMVLGIEKETAARFSFILAIPAILGALLLHLNDLQSFTTSLALPLAVGFILSFIVGYLTLRILLYVIRKDNFHVFSIYCWVLGTFILVWVLVLGH